MSGPRPRLVFVSPIFLFPADAGGKIRSTNILRGLKGGAFDVTLMSPARIGEAQRHRADLEAVCDRYVPWVPPPPRPRWSRALDLLGATPVNVATDRSPAGLAAVRAMADSGKADLMVFDFVHASVLRPDTMPFPTVCFTHNVEAEIFQRHAANARGPLWRWVWSSQWRKMAAFERAALRAYDGVVAVSERDAQQFRLDYGLGQVGAIPTGVDLDFFSWQPPVDPAPGQPLTVLFSGSMDSIANVDGVRYFLDAIWPRIAAASPEARFIVVGRNPPAALVQQARRSPRVEVTGFVDDVRPYMRLAQVAVIPLQVGGGTRIKAFESMAVGTPVVSTSVGIEGLDVEPERHYLRRDDAEGFAAAVLQLLSDDPRRQSLSRAARSEVEARFGHRVAAQSFERICLGTLQRQRAA